jgi:myo-inositol-1(or 4)-monophosphatase
VGLSPWTSPPAARRSGSRGLIGDLSGEGDYLHGGQVIAANPKVFAQMVTALAPFRTELTRERRPAPVAPAP